jgi:hypothetical protein
LLNTSASLTTDGHAARMLSFTRILIGLPQIQTDRY